MFFLLELCFTRSNVLYSPTLASHFHKLLSVSFQMVSIICISLLQVLSYRQLDLGMSFQAKKRGPVMFIYQGVQGVNMISPAIFWYKSNWAFTQDIVLIKEVQYSYIYHTTENLPQVTVHTNASVIVRVKLVSVLKDWGYESLIPNVREITYTQDQIQQF